MTKDFFKQYNQEPSYKDTDTLKKFISARGKIIGREKSGLSAINQRKVAKHIKYARYLALLPFTSYQKERVLHSRKGSSEVVEE